jgi:DNA-binding GntR family transcriptional regulator
MRDHTADAIRELLLSGSLEPGAPIRELELASQLDVSRNPVREALVRLEGEGLVEFHGPQRGHRVRLITPDSLRDLYDARAVIEARCAELAAARGQVSCDDLRAKADELGAAYREGDRSRLARMDMEFHEIIVRAAGNSVLTDMWLRIRNQMLFATNFALRSLYEQVYGIEEAHVRLIETFAQDEPERAGELARKHVLHFLKMYEQLEAGRSGP